MYDKRLASEILQFLESSYPDRVNLEELKARLPEFEAANQEWLRAIAVLEGEGKLTGKFLHTGLANAFQDATMLQITSAGREFVARRNQQQGQVQLDARLNIPGPGAFDNDLPAFCLTASTEKPLSVIVVDIDHFKDVNDTHGHEVGNEVLKEISATLTAGCQGKGKVYRYGGDEIAILLENYSLPEAEVLAERLRAQISRVRGANNPPAVTASIGVATFPEPVGNAKLLFKSADDAALAAKRNGRNQVRTVASSATAQQVIPLTRQSLSVYMRTDERVRKLDEQLALHSGQQFTPAEDSSLHVFEKAKHLQLNSIDDVAALARKFGDLSQKLACCAVPTTPVSAGQSLTYVFDIAAAAQGLPALRSYFQSLKYTSTDEGYISEIIEILGLLTQKTG